jgi:uncharacterized protein
MENPCINCGACCAYFRVSFHWSEADAFLGGKVPEQHTTPILGTQRIAMKGTGVKGCSCVCLEGNIGQSVRCGIYHDRPSVCRQFGVQESPTGTLTCNSQDFDRCSQARAFFGIAPLDASILCDDELPPNTPYPVAS